MVLFGDPLLLHALAGGIPRWEGRQQQPTSPAEPVMHKNNMVQDKCSIMEEGGGRWVVRLLATGAEDEVELGRLALGMKLSNEKQVRKVR